MKRILLGSISIAAISIGSTALAQENAANDVEGELARCYSYVSGTAGENVVESLKRGDAVRAKDESASQDAVEGSGMSESAMREIEEAFADGKIIAGPSGSDEQAASGDGETAQSAADGAAGETGEPAERTAAIGEQSESATTTTEPDRALTAEAQEKARSALTVARAFFPEVDFSRWSRANSADAAFVFAGDHVGTGREVRVYMTTDGSIAEIEEEIPLRAVPRPVRELIGASVNGLRVSDTSRSLREDFDVYYEFSGVLRSGRPVSLEIRADGSDFTLSSPLNG